MSRILLSSFHGMISSFHGMIPSFHDMISSFHAVFGLRDKAAKGSADKQGGKGIPLQTSFHRKRLRWQMQTFTMADANVYNGGCKRLREKAHSFGESDPAWPISVPRASYSSRERPWGEDLTPALLGLEIYHASNGPLTNRAEDRGLVYLHATFLTGTIDTL